MSEHVTVQGDPRREVCPNCNARPGQPCTQPTDTGRRDVQWFHLARLTASQKQAGQ